MSNLTVRNGRLVLPDGVRTGSITVTDGRISAIGGHAPVTGRVVEAGGAYVLPGLIDSHVHFRTPGLTGKEEWLTGSMAAAAGGVTTVADMPNTVPPLFTPEDAYAKAELIEGRSLVDYRFHLGVHPDDPGGLRAFTPREGTTAKVFLCGHHTAPHVMRNAERLRETFAIAREVGLRLVVHAEDSGVFALLDAWRGQPVSYREYEPARPRSGAIVAVARLIELCQEFGTQVHVLHVSTAEEADLLAAAGSAGLPVSFEVTGHHLSFEDRDVDRLGARIRLSPAIRGAGDRERLWKAVTSGEAATLGSDHAPHAQADKLLPAAEAPPGLPGTQELVHSVWTGLRRRDPEGSPDDHARLIARVLADGPARLLGLTARKGRLEVGLDGDLVLFDPDENWTLDRTAVATKVGWSAYEGWTFTGRVRTTIRRGEISYDRGVFGTPSGQWLEGAPHEFPGRGNGAASGFQRLDQPE
ncbi:dihydroorotase family protein [Nonomuraea sp. NPDC050691]|uniref:dihydroorotase n=1 Tax=Nonomuraea sp. NPDC050691 TaxID=3155661 RepID=UPI0033ECB8E7